MNIVFVLVLQLRFIIIIIIVCHILLLQFIIIVHNLIVNINHMNV